MLRDALRSLPETVFADLLESDEAYLLVFDLPGATAETVDARVEDGQLWVEAHREKDVDEGYRYLSEERSLFLDFEVPLPPDVAADGAEANIERGVLEVRLPKVTATTRSIPVEG